MDKNDAIKLSIRYLNRLRDSDLMFTETWPFGSYSNNNQNPDSDIDLAIVLDDKIRHTFDIEVKLMVIRKGEETIIEPHAFSKDEFDSGVPLVEQIRKYGERLEI